MWIARDQTGELGLWIVKPERVKAADEYKKNGYWDFDHKVDKDVFVSLQENLFPNLKWEDDPIEVEIIKKL